MDGSSREILKVAPTAAFRRAPPVPGPTQERVLRVELTRSQRQRNGRSLRNPVFDARIRL
jgi:hypothetical protein